MTFEATVEGLPPNEKLFETLLFRGFAVEPHKGGLLLKDCTQLG